MKFLFTLLLLTIFAHASYIRSIRVTSYLEKSRAEQEITKLQEFVQTHSKLKKLEKKLDFKYTIHKIDKYYLIVIEPLTDKVAVQEILDILRVKYKNAYPRKLQTMPKFVQKIEKKVIPLVPTIEVRSISTLKKRKTQQNKEQEVKQEVKPSQNITAKPHDNTSNITNNLDLNPAEENISFLLILIVSLLLVISFLYIYFLRKKRKKKVHSKTLTEIVLENKDEFKLQNQNINGSSEDNETLTESTYNKNMKSVADSELKIKYKYQELNTATGLSSFNNDVITYQTRLKNFKEKYLDSAIVLEKLCNNSNFSQALQIIGQLKEESTQIGAFNLLENIKAMEKEIGLGENAQWDKSIWAYGITLKNLSAEINHYIKIAL